MSMIEELLAAARGSVGVSSQQGGEVVSTGREYDERDRELAEQLKAEAEIRRSAHALQNELDKVQRNAPAESKESRRDTITRHSRSRSDIAGHIAISRGTFEVNRRRRQEQQLMVADSASWPGIAYVNGKRFTDPAFGHSDLSGADGDITGSMNLWVKVVVTPGAETVEYVDSPAFVGGAFPSDTEYYEVQHQLCPISVTRFG